MSIFSFFDELRYEFGPARYVGKRYHIRTSWFGENIEGKGIVTNFLRAEEKRYFYAMTTPSDCKIVMLGLIKERSNWFVQVRAERSFVLELQCQLSFLK
jgi:hypothetical protein